MFRKLLNIWGKYKTVAITGAVVVSLLLNTYFYVSQRNLQLQLQHNGKVTVAYVKFLSFKDTPWKLFLNKGEKYFFVTENNDTITDYKKRIDQGKLDVLQNMNMFFPVDTVIYNVHKPKQYLFYKDYKLYNEGYAIISYFIIGPLFLAIWLFGVASFILAALKKRGVVNF